MRADKIFCFLLFVLSVTAQAVLATGVEQAPDYQATVLELKADIDKKLAKLSQEKKDEHKALAKDLASRVKINDQDKKHLLELNKKVGKKVQGCGFIPEDNLSSSTTTTQDKQIYIFVSSSMKKPNLIRLGKQAAAQGASLVMRGFIENSYLKTAVFLKEVVEKTGQGVAIDPSLFKAYRVTEVPTFIVADGDRYDKLSGNVSLDYAISEIKSKGEVFNETANNNENN